MLMFVQPGFTDNWPQIELSASALAHADQLALLQWGRASEHVCV